MKAIKKETENKKRKLMNELMQLTKENTMLAFSGGADSALLLKMLCEASKINGTTVYAVTVDTRLHPSGDLETAKKVAEEMGAAHEIIMLDELKDAQIEFNPKDRCYLCKQAIFTKIRKRAELRNIRYIFEGTNMDDLHEYRPGIKALKELDIRSPLAENGLSKEEVRVFAGMYGISVAQRPAAPCLATRFPYDTRLDYKILEQVGKGEEFIRSLGFYNVRLRVHGEVVRIEVDNEDFTKLIMRKDEITTKLKELGFVYITADLEGFRSGSMDIDL